MSIFVKFIRFLLKYILLAILKQNKKFLKDFFLFSIINVNDNTLIYFVFLCKREIKNF